MITANSHFMNNPYPTKPRGLPVRNWQEWKRYVIEPLMKSKLVPDMGYDTGEPLTAQVRQGYWIVLCPCGGAEYVWEEGGMMCLSCLNAAHGHRYRRTKFPRKRREIEDILIIRPLINRNWLPGETVKDLERENHQHETELLRAII
ncbi:MAG: hypothetical protein Q8P44_00555 [Dehalococcoidia bacterium]|nr:hypothetical protein [Dehalococcoidia bacterium]